MKLKTVLLFLPPINNVVIPRARDSKAADSNP